MHFSKVEICGVNTAKLQNLSDEEKRELLKRTKDGDETAREKLIDGNLRLVLSIIQRFSNRKCCFLFADFKLCSSGIIGRSDSCAC